MDERKYNRIVNNPRHIPGIHNYCDRWCECCLFTLRCSVFAVEEVLTKGKPERYPGIANLWPRLEAAAEFAGGMLKEGLEHPGVEVVKDPILKKKSNRPTDTHRLGVASKRYMEFAHAFINKYEKVISKLPADKGVHAVSAAEALQVIAWFHMMIMVKLSRALSQREYEDDFDEEEVEGMPRDEDGSAKIALIGMDRCIIAWAILALHVPEHVEAARSAMVTLHRLRVGVEKEFPKARLFVRPGFDDHTFGKRKK